MTRSDYVELMSRYLSGQGAIDLEHGLEEGETRVRNLVPELDIGETQNLGVLREDGYAIYLGLIQKFQIPTGEQIVVLGSYANTILNNRVTTMYLYTKFTDDALDGLLARNRDLVDRTITANER